MTVIYDQQTHNQRRIGLAIEHVKRLHDDGSFKTPEQISILERIESLWLRLEAALEKEKAISEKKKAFRELVLSRIGFVDSLKRDLKSGTISLDDDPYNTAMNQLRGIGEILLTAVESGEDSVSEAPVSEAQAKEEQDFVIGVDFNVDPIEVFLSPNDYFVQALDAVTDWVKEEELDISLTECNSLVKRILNVVVNSQIPN